MKKTVLVTGGANGLGRSLALLYARRGWWVAVADIDSAAGQSVVTEIRHLGGNGDSFELDVTDDESWLQLREDLQSAHPQLDLLINCAAKLTVAEVGDLPLPIERTALDVALLGTVYGCQTMIPWMKRNKHSQVVNVASCAAFLGLPWSAAYNAAKAGVVAYSETLRNELLPHGVHVTVACPGFFSSGLFQRATYASDVLRDTVAHIVEKTTVDPQTVASVIAQAVEQRQLYVMTPFAVRKLWWLKRLAPTRLLSHIAARAWRIRGRFSGDPN